MPPTPWESERSSGETEQEEMQVLVWLHPQAEQLDDMSEVRDEGRQRMLLETTSPAVLLVRLVLRAAT